MHRKPQQTDDSWESDEVWNLLDQAPPTAASPRFVENTVRAARLAGQPAPWWQRLVSPLPLATMAGATAALAFALITWYGTRTGLDDAAVAAEAPHAAEIQDLAETETLIAAVDQLDDFSDMELVSLIGF